MRRLFRHATWYTCPLLMTVQWALMRLTLRPVYWRDGALYRRHTRGTDSWGVQVRAWWPTWMILAECWLWNNGPVTWWWRLRLALRGPGEG